MRLFLLSFLLFFIPGCRSDDVKPERIENKKSFVIKEINDVGLNKLIKDRKGKTLFINVWATWCAPCIEEFPDIVRISEFYKDKDVDFVSLNVDMSSQVDSLVTPFLRTFDADFVVYNVKEKDAENIINILNPEWSGAIPASFIYDKNGDRKIFILGSEKFQNFSDAIDSVRSLNES